MLIIIGALTLLVVVLFYAFGLGAQQGMNTVYRHFHVGLRDMERRSVHSYDPNSPNRRFIDKYRPGGDYERTKFER